MASGSRTNKGTKALAAIIPGVLELISSSSIAHRAAALAVANAMLISGMSTWGKEFAFAPMKLKQDSVHDALSVLADHHLKLEAALEAVVGRPPADPFIAACKWELIATQAVMVTAGASLDRQYADTARKVWKLLGSSRRASEAAVRLLFEYGKAYSVSPIPEIPGKVPDKQFLASLAGSLPPMFRPAEGRK